MSHRQQSRNGRSATPTELAAEHDRETSLLRYLAGHGEVRIADFAEMSDVSEREIVSDVAHL